MNQIIDWRSYYYEFWVYDGLESFGIVHAEDILNLLSDWSGSGLEDAVCLNVSKLDPDSMKLYHPEYFEHYPFGLPEADEPYKWKPCFKHQWTSWQRMKPVEIRIKSRRCKRCNKKEKVRG